MTLSFHYKNLERPDGSKVKVPLIPITLYGKESVETDCMIDSGADMSAMPREIAESLGVDLCGKHHQARGIGGMVEAVETIVPIKIQKGHESYRFNVPMKVILSGNYGFPILLGREFFFDQFVIIFNQCDQRILLKKVNGQTA